MIKKVNNKKMQTKTKTQIISIILSVVLSVGLVAAVTYAASTIGNDVTVGGNLTVTGTTTLTGALGKVKVGGTGANAIALSNAASPDWGLETNTKVTSDMGTWYGAANSAYMTVSNAQTGNTSIFGTLSELDLGSAVNLSGSRNYAAVWGDLEILGATTLGAGSSGTTLWTGAVVGSVIGSNTQVNSDYRQLAAIIADSNLGTAVTPGTGGSISGILIRKSLGKTAWPVGLLIDSGAATADIQLSSGVQILTGTTDPNGSITAANGSVYIRAGTGNEDTTIYTNTDGGTTWAPADL